VQCVHETQDWNVCVNTVEGREYVFAADSTDDRDGVFSSRWSYITSLIGVVRCSSPKFLDLDWVGSLHGSALLLSPSPVVKVSLGLKHDGGLR
jgi:hypothetical protein